MNIKYFAIIDAFHLGDVASIMGLFVTIIGFIITIFNVIKSKNSSKVAEETVSKVRQDLRLYQTVNGFSDALATMDEIKRLHRQTEWKLLPDRYNSLRKSLISIRCENPILSDNDQQEIQSAISQFSALETLIDKHLLSENNTPIDIPKINKQVSKQIDRIQEILVRLNSNIGS